MNQKLASGLEPFNEKSDRLLMKKKMYQMVLSWQAPRHVNSVANVLSLEYGEFLEICFKRGCGWSLIFNKKNDSAYFCRFATNLGSFCPFIMEGRNTHTYYLLRIESVACCYTHSSRKKFTYCVVFRKGAGQRYCHVDMSYSHEILPRTHPEFLLYIVLCCCKSLQKIIYVLLTKCIIRALPTSCMNFFQIIVWPKKCILQVAIKESEVKRIIFVPRTKKTSTFTYSFRLDNFYISR